MKHYIRAANPMRAQFDIMATYQSATCLCIRGRRHSDAEPANGKTLAFGSYAELRNLFRAFWTRPPTSVSSCGCRQQFCSGGDVHEIIGPLTTI
jgi:hypothetical protein